MIRRGHYVKHHIKHSLEKNQQLCMYIVKLETLFPSRNNSNCLLWKSAKSAMRFGWRNQSCQGAQQNPHRIAKITCHEKAIQASAQLALDSHLTKC